MEPNELLKFLKSNELFKELDDAELSSLLPLLEEKTFRKDEWVIREGETGENLFLILSGRAEIIKEQTEEKEFQLLGLLEPGDWVGEMAHFEKDRRSASIRPIEEVSVLILSLEDLSRAPDKQKIYSKIIHRLTTRISQRLRKTDENLLDALKEKLSLLQAHSRLAKTLIHLLIAIAIYYNLSRAFSTYLSKFQVISGYFTPLIVLLIAISCLWIMLSSDYPLSYYGLSLKNWKHDLLYAFLYSIPAMGVIYLIAWFSVRFVPAAKGEPMYFDFAGQDPKIMLLIWGTYFALVPLQELIVRGFMQTCMRNFLLGPTRVFFAILSSNLVFELFHTMRGIWFSLFVFGFGIFWGFIYEKQRTIVGVSLSHALLAAWAFLFLNFQHLLTLVP